MKPLLGKKVLLIGIGFYDYEAAISESLRDLGAEVSTEIERPLRTKAALVRHPRSSESELIARHYEGIIGRSHAAGGADYVIVIKGEFLDEKRFAALRVANPDAQFVAYHWDSMARYPDLRERQRLYDRVLTFDHLDAAELPNFHLRPLFFRPELEANGIFDGGSIDLSFVGWLHHERLEQVENIRNQLKEANATGFFYLSTGFFTHAKLTVSGRSRDVYSRPLPFSQYAGILNRSSVVLDLPHPEQSGLTMRAIEAICTGKKLITTARDVLRYDFYHPDNVMLVDWDTLEFDPDFLFEAPKLLDRSVIEKYSLRKWVLNVCGIEHLETFIR